MNKMNRISKSFLVLSLMSLSTLALAEDPLVTDPDKYTLVFQNERVRVLAYHDKPGDKTNRHNHPDSIVYAISPFKRKLVLGNGKELVVEINEGQTNWVPAQSHVGENIGTTETHVIIVELQEAKEVK